ncbi:MAG: DMT family transporter [Betaproteobacteria bacterium]|nr:MAG: DMT family transporter [Betaproteobacteria bacterium]
MKDQHTLPRALWLLLAALTLFWGLNWPMMKLALAELPPWTFRAACLSFGAAGLFIIARAQGLRIRPRERQWMRLAFASLFNVTGWNLLIAYGVSILPSGRSAILAYTMPLWTVILSAMFLRERFTRRKFIGVLLGMVALILLLGPDVSYVESAPIGAAFVVGAALSWATGTVIIKRWPIDLPTTSFVAWQLALGGLPVVFGALFLDWASWQPVSLAATTALLYNILVATVLCNWAWFRIATTAPASIAALATMMIPVVGVFSGMLVLGEQPGWQEYVALLLVTLALATVLLPPRVALPAHQPGRQKKSA